MKPENKGQTVGEKYSMKRLLQLLSSRSLLPRVRVPAFGHGSLPPSLGPSSVFWAKLIPTIIINQMKIYSHCSTPITLLTGSGHDLQLMSRIPPCSLKHIYAPCSLQHIDRFTICSGDVPSRTDDSYQLQSYDAAINPNTFHGSTPRHSGTAPGGRNHQLQIRRHPRTNPGVGTINFRPRRSCDPHYKQARLWPPSCGRKGGVVLAKYKEIKALRLKVRNQEEAGEMAAAENVSLRGQLKNREEELNDLKDTAETTAMAVNGGKVAARWELMREWINGQTDSSDPTNVLEQYKTVKITEAKLLGLPTPSFESELRVLGDVEAEKIPEPVADDPSVQPSDSNLYPPNS
ncbi:hypothetical protein YC2023_081483 [Brassica napus]